MIGSSSGTPHAFLKEAISSARIEGASIVAHASGNPDQRRFPDMQDQVRGPVFLRRTAVELDGIGNVGHGFVVR